MKVLRKVNGKNCYKPLLLFLEFVNSLKQGQDNNLTITIQHKCIVFYFHSYL